MIYVSIAINVVLLIAIIIVTKKGFKRTFKDIKENIDEQLQKNNKVPEIKLDTKILEKMIDGVPGKVLQSITNSSNTHKGALGELIGYIELRAAYDRIIPIGNIVDFICIKLPKDGREGCIDFVDVKTGHKARLSKDQRELQQLIKDKKINFCTLKINNVTSPTVSQESDSTKDNSI